jgi:cytochrome c553
MFRKYFKFGFVIASFAVALMTLDIARPSAQVVTEKAASQVKMPEVIKLAKGSKQGEVTFNHTKHNGGDYSVGGPIACIECHHVSQPASEAAKYPPLKTVWPSDRTTTLTIDLFNKDPNGAAVAKCHDCHARQGEKPKLMQAIPELKDPGSTTITTLTNQLAFHQACDSCHFQIQMNRVGSKVPNSVVCSSCHKRAES